MPAVHGAELFLAVWQPDRHGIVGKLRRHHVVVHVDAPAPRARLIHCLVRFLSVVNDPATFLCLCGQTYLITNLPVNLNRAAAVR
jgi:hypothetical protein